MRNIWTHDVRCYYGKNAQPPRKPGELAIAINTAGYATNMEIEAGKSRPDIGRITVRDLSTGKITIFDKEFDQDSTTNDSTP